MNSDTEIRPVAISGAGGFIGSHVSAFLSGRGYPAIPLHRDLFAPGQESNLTTLLASCGTVINLAGAPIFHRWTSSYKKKIYSSRIDTTRKIVEAIARLDRKPELFISASASGYYPSTGCYTEENGVKGTGFLADVCEAWEKEAMKIKDVRCVTTRFGVVFAKQGGAFEKIALPARMGLPVIPGPGSQPLPWIDIKDLVHVMQFIMDHKEITGPVNCVAPQQLTYASLAAQLQSVYHTIGKIKIPTFLMRMGLGKAATFMTEGQCLYPAKLQQAGYTFLSPTLDSFLKGVK